MSAANGTPTRVSCRTDPLTRCIGNGKAATTASSKVSMLSMEPEVRASTTVPNSTPRDLEHHQNNEVDNVGSNTGSLPTAKAVTSTTASHPPNQAAEIVKATVEEEQPVGNSLNSATGSLNTGQSVAGEGLNMEKTTTTAKAEKPTLAEEEHPDFAAGVEVKSSVLTKEQLKFCANVLRGLKRHPQSPPFQQPVDPVALNIPDYFDIIKHPMDLSAISKKMEANEYKDAEAFIADVRLMLQNCFTYNHPDSQVVKMGHALEKYFNTQLGKIPTTVPSHSTSSAMDDSARRKSEPVTNVTPLAASRARRESHAPARHTPVPAVSTPRARSRSSANPEMSFCNGILRELLKKSNQTVTWPFLEPVDPIKLGIPDYFDVIKTPMDLSTVRRKLDTNQYKTADQFEADIRLIISNCYAYNAPDSDVVGICRGFEKLFNSKWAQKPSHFASPVSGGFSTYHEDEDSDSEKILEINRQIQALQQELNHLLMKRKNRSSVSSAARPKKAKSSATTSFGMASAPSAARAAPIAEEEFLNTPMTFEEKRELSVQVNNLPPEKLGRVVEIIQSGMSLEAQGDSDVIELDIESLNVRTLRQLQRYVMECQGITSLSAILKMGAGKKGQRKKSTTVAAGSAPTSAAASGNSKKSKGGMMASTNNNLSTINNPSNSMATAAAVAAMSSEDETSDDDLD